MTVEFEIEGQKFIAINGGPLFNSLQPYPFWSPAVRRRKSTLSGRDCPKAARRLMELGEYPFSERYGWTQDRYGLSWQVMFMGDRR